MKKKNRRFWKKGQAGAALFLALCLGAGHLFSMAVEGSGGEGENPQKNLQDAVAHIYPFDGDASDWGEDRVSGSALGNVSYGEGKFGQAVCLDGSGGIVYPTDILNDSGSFTVSLWAYTEFPPGGEGRLLSTGVWGDHTPGVTLGLFSGTDGSSSWAGITYGMGKESGESYFDWSWTVPGEQVYQTWAHVAAVFDREENLVKVYLNGEEKDRYSLEGYQTDSPLDVFAVGGHLENGAVSAGYVGRIDEMILFDRALTGEEVRVLSGAQETMRPCRVVFQENGGEPVEDVLAYPGELVSPVEIRYGDEGVHKSFIGWSVDETEYRPYDFRMPVFEDLTLYAFWYQEEGTEQSAMVDNLTVLGVDHYYAFEGNAADTGLEANLKGTVTGAVNGEEKGAVSYGYGKYGRGIYLDGKSYVKLPAAMLKDQGDFTISLWAKPDIGDNENARLVSTGVWGPDTPGIVLGLHTNVSPEGSWADAIYGVGRKSGDSYFNWSYAVPYEAVQNNWVHLTGVYCETGKTFKVFINGEEKAAFSSEGYSADSMMEYFALGGHLTEDGIQEAYTGYIDELAFFDRALSGEQVRLVYSNQNAAGADTPGNPNRPEEPDTPGNPNRPEEPDTPGNPNRPGESDTPDGTAYRKSQDHVGTAHYYTFDNADGADSFADGTAGVLAGSPQFVPGIEGMALKLDGRSYMRLPSAMLNDGGDFSISLWASPEISDNENIRLISTGVWGPDTPGIVLGLHTNVSPEGSWADAIYGVGREGGDSYFSWSEAVPYETVSQGWAHLVGVYSDARQEMKVYINGEEKAAFSYEGYSTDSLMKYIALGGHLTEEGLMEGYRGLLDEVKIYDKALTPETVAEEYQRLGERKTEESEDAKKTYRKSQDDAGTAHYYTFDNENGADAFEDGNAGELVGTCRFAQGLSGKALELDGRSYMRLPSAMLNDGGDFSISLWASPEILDNENIRLISTGVWGPDTPGIVLGLHTNVSPEGSWADAIYGVGREGGDSYFSWSEAVPYETVSQGWAHLVGVYSAARQEMKIYINGEEKACYSYEGYDTDSDMEYFALGGHLTEEGLMEGYRGLLDEVKIFDKALTPEETRKEYSRFGAGPKETRNAPRTSVYCRKSEGFLGVAHYYSFDEEDASDFFSDGVDGVLAGRPEFVEGKYGMALKLDGESYVKLPTAILAAPESFTVSMWVLSQVEDNKQARLISTGAWGEDSPGIALGVHSNVTGEGKWADLIYGIGREKGETYFDWSYAVDYEVIQGNWSHVALICDTQEGTVKVYVNGEEKDRFEYDGYSALSNQEYFALGGHLADGTLGEGFSGLMDEVVIFDRALTPEEMLLASSGPMLHTVSFETNGGSPIEPERVFTGDTLKEPETTREALAGEEAYHMAAWSTHPEAYLPYDFEKPVTSDMTLYAMWRQGDQVTVRFEGYEELTQVRKAGEKVEEPKPPVREGYEFYKWYWDQDMTVEFDFDQPVWVDATLRPKWARTSSANREEIVEMEVPAAKTPAFRISAAVAATAGILSAAVIGGVYVRRRRKRR